jgi:hypothetical protein
VLGLATLSRKGAKRERKSRARRPLPASGER